MSITFTMITLHSRSSTWYDRSIYCNVIIASCTARHSLKNAAHSDIKDEPEHRFGNRRKLLVEATSDVAAASTLALGAYPVNPISLWRHIDTRASSKQTDGSSTDRAAYGSLGQGSAGG